MLNTDIVPLGANGGVLSSARAIDDTEWRAICDGLSRRVHGTFASIKAGAYLPWGDPLTFGLLKLLEVDASISSIEVWPERVAVMLDGTRRDWLAKLRVRYGRGVAILEPVTDAMASRPAYMRLAAALTQAYWQRGVVFRTVLESEIRLQPRLGNTEHILAHRHFDVTPEAELHVREALSLGRAHTVGSLAAALPHLDPARPAIYAMALRGALTLNLGAAQPDDMPVRLRARKG
ncbi:MAG: hypothetical protein FD119_129 [Stygiobacter sp.]|nr:MAG: hypothetical protein FD119_129 [Stygiobacter sp.]